MSARPPDRRLPGGHSPGWPRPLRCLSRRPRGQIEWIWPADVPLTARRALPDVLCIVLRAWRVPLAAAGLAALAGLLSPRGPATLLVCALLVAVEETAHLVAAARAAPSAHLSLVTRPPLRTAARVRPPLLPADAAAAALAGPLAACVVGLVCVSAPCLVAQALLASGPGPYLAWTPALAPPAWGVLAALPLPGSDAAIARTARRRAGLTRRAVLARAVWLLGPRLPLGSREESGVSVP